MKRFLLELRRRRVFRTIALYIVATWVLMQVADVVFPALDIPERAMRYVLLGALLFFPGVVVFSWFYDISSEGVRRTVAAGPEELSSPRPLKRIDYLWLAALLSIALAVFYSMAGRVSEEPEQSSAPTREGPPVVAVLPFSISGIGGDNEFFANGLHDELLTRLAQLESMRVISRTSVMEYANTTHNIREIGATLGADSILEGSVQSTPELIRINVQLIDAHTDEHLWAQDYQREMTAANIFDIQSEIARAIASAMRATLTPQDVNQLREIPTENLAAYRAYVKALEVGKAKGLWRVAEYGQALEEAVELDPTFTRAMAELVGFLSFQNFWWEVDPELTRQAEQLLEQIHTLSPNSADDLTAQAFYTYYSLKNFEQAISLVDQALKLRPSDISLLEMKSYILRRVDRADERIETIRLLQKLDPRNRIWPGSLTLQLMQLHRYDEAAREISLAKVDSYDLQYWNNLLQFRQHGDIERWAREAEKLHQDYPDQAEATNLWFAYLAARDFLSAEQWLPQLDDTTPDNAPFLSDRAVSQLMLYRITGQPERLAEVLTAAKLKMEPALDSEGNVLAAATLNVHLALISAAENNPLETERLIRRWKTDPSADVYDYVAYANLGCQALGMSGATSAATQCIRDAMQTPSMVFGFFEPYLPYYDLIRNEPEFQALLAEIEATP